MGANRVTPTSKPIHDETSHLRTALEYFAVNDPHAPRRKREADQRFRGRSQDIDW
jgi:hypothetical protein